MCSGYARPISATVRLYRTLAAVGRAEPVPRTVAIGVFDGLHLGHQEILAQTKLISRKYSGVSTVCSFEPMPTEFFSPGAPPARLTCFRERFERLDELGIDEMFCPRFASIRDLTPDAFIEDLLVGALGVRCVVVGDDFRFGAERRGTLEDLHEGGRRCGFRVTTVPPVYSNAQRVSSTVIRAALKAGDLAAAKRMLGRDYSMSGRVVRGLGVGKKLGFPTANLELKRRVAPVDGIFAVRVSGLGDKLIDGVASVGNRPMVGGGKVLLEVFLFDFDRDIYGRYLTVRFVTRLREERTFADIAAMQAQMHLDVRDAKAALRARIA
jgi:riboflavin kinase/FMN adenylyltransferase